MGRRSRQRASAPQRERATVTPAAPQAARPDAASPDPPNAAPLPTAARRSRREQAPRPPWGAFPLVELCALAAIVLGAWGFLRGGHGGAVLLLGAMLLGSVAGLEVALREHLGGYRSHTLLLSGVLAFATLAVLVVANAQRPVLIAGAAAGLLAGVPLFRWLFKRRSGGVGMKVR
ncbi:MAG TPA: hypothetical protein VFU94_08175 [Conexibacter sp.]|nr:hypothetical protein [Conexibacter sp.]